MDNFFDWLRHWVDKIAEMFKNTKEWLNKVFPQEGSVTTEGETDA